MTFQGARTGLRGAGVPNGGLIVGAARLDRVEGLRRGQWGFELLVQPGYRLADLRRDLATRRPNLAASQAEPEALKELLAEFRAEELFWPPDPSETSATMGGLASTNASGPNRSRFGRAADHLSGLRVILHDGQEYNLERGAFKFGPQGLPLPTGRLLEADPKALGLPPEADLLDLLAGGQGMYGFISGLWLKLAKAPAHLWGLVFFPDSEEKAVSLIEAILDDPPEALISLDFLDLPSLSVVSVLRQSAKKLREIPEPPTGAASAVSLELMADDESLIESASERIIQNCLDRGCDPDQSWALVGTEVEKSRLFAHAVPEGLGSLLDSVRAGGYPAVMTATDFTRPDLRFGQNLGECRRDLREMGLTAVTFGHALDNHLSVNFLPKNAEEAKRATELMGHWLERAKNAGGELFFGQGVGKLKKELFLAHESPERIASLRAAKKALDPNGLFNPGNLFD
jgi:D-lactate dehydrogenase (cytochrome)